MRLISFLFFIIIYQSIYSQDAEVLFNNGIIHIKNFEINFIDTVFNNKLYRFPAGWKIAPGRDSILIAYPESWAVKEGKDGHLVAYPHIWKTNYSPDGRIVAFPYQEKTITIRKKIDNCIEPDTSKCYKNIEKKVNKFGIYTQTGSDKRQVIYSNKMILAKGADGRLINIPDDWEVSQNDRGRLTAYPKNWVVYEIGNKQFAMPENWEIDIETDKPKIITGDKFIKFIYTPVEKYEIAKYIYENDKVNGLKYLLYLLVNQ